MTLQALDLALGLCEPLGLQCVRVWAHAFVAELFADLAELLEQDVEPACARLLREEVLLFLRQLLQDPPDAEPAGTGFEQQLPELALSGEHVLGGALEIFVIEAEQPREPR